MPITETAVITKEREADRPGTRVPDRPQAPASGRIALGSTVRVLDLERGELMEFALVGPGELDPDRGRISPASPIGRALVGRAAGERVTVLAPRGRLLFEVVEIR